MYRRHLRLRHHHRRVVHLAEPWSLLAVCVSVSLPPPWVAVMSGAEPTKPFRTDGCSLWPDGPWRGCCVAHDRLYWRGGSPAQRLAADRALRDCVARGGHKRIAWLMYAGVRFGGSRWFPTWFRWGYGHEWPKDGSK